MVTTHISFFAMLNPFSTLERKIQVLNMLYDLSNGDITKPVILEDIAEKAGIDRLELESDLVRLEKEGFIDGSEGRTFRDAPWSMKVLLKGEKYLEQRLKADKLYVRPYEIKAVSHGLLEALAEHSIKNNGLINLKQIGEQLNLPEELLGQSVNYLEKNGFLIGHGNNKDAWYPSYGTITDEGMRSVQNPALNDLGGILMEHLATSVGEVFDKDDILKIFHWKTSTFQNIVSYLWMLEEVQIHEADAAGKPILIQISAKGMKGTHSSIQVQNQMTTQNRSTGVKVFIVHGHNHTIRDQIKIFITDLGIETVIMDAEANLGQALPEKLERTASQCSFAVFLLTADDHLMDLKSDKEIRRARQNVILEIGFFWGALGRNTKCAFLVENVNGMDLPSDIQGLGWIPITDDLGVTKLKLRQELEGAGLL